MTTYLLTTDKRVQVVPTSLISGWNYLTNVREELGCQEDDMLPIPLSDKQCDIWLDLCIRMETRYLQECQESHGQYFIQEANSEGVLVFYPMEHVPLPLRSEVVPIVRLMDPSDGDWVLYCIPDNFVEVHQTEATEDEVKRRVYAQIGWHVRHDGPEYMSHPCISPSGVGVLHADWENCVEEGEGDERVYRCLEGPNVVAGIVYACWMRLGCPSTMTWTSLDWNEMIDMGVARTVYSMMTSSGEDLKDELLMVEDEPPACPIFISILAHDGSRVHPHIQTNIQEAFAIRRGTTILDTTEYQRRLGLWYEHLFSLATTVEDKERILSLSGIQDLVFLGAPSFRWRPFALRRAIPTPSTKVLLHHYADFCRERALNTE